FDAMLQANAPIVEAQRAVWTIPPDPKRAAAALTRAATYDYFAEDPALPALAAEPDTTNDLTPIRRVEMGRKLEARSLTAPYAARSRTREVIESRVERTPQLLTVELTVEERSTYQRTTESLRSQSHGLHGVSVFALIARQRQMASSLPA